MRNNNTIQKIRFNAWHLLGLYSQGLLNESFAGADLLAIDELACNLYRAMVKARPFLSGEALEYAAVVMHAFEEFHDLGPGELPTDPYERPPEITRQLQQQGLIP